MPWWWYAVWMLTTTPCCSSTVTGPRWVHTSHTYVYVCIYRSPQYNTIKYVYMHDGVCVCLRGGWGVEFGPTTKSLITPYTPRRGSVARAFVQGREVEHRWPDRARPPHPLSVNPAMHGHGCGPRRGLLKAVIIATQNFAHTTVALTARRRERRGAVVPRWCTDFCMKITIPFWSPRRGPHRVHTHRLHLQYYIYIYTLYIHTLYIHIIHDNAGKGGPIRGPRSAPS